MKIMSIIGARPQFIKAAPVSKAFINKGIEEILAHTGQHYDHNMSAVFFNDLGIPQPKYNLGMGGGHHGEQTGKMLEGIEKLLLEEKPDWMLVYGDTNSTLAGALAAAKLHIPVAHVEAGLRSFNKKMPEEINRILTDHVSELLFAPTSLAVNNLENENLPAKKIKLVGDVMYDAVLMFGSIAGEKSRVLEEMELKPRDYALATIHRAENTNDAKRLEKIFSGLTTIAANYFPVLLPLHPRTRKYIDQNQIDTGHIKITAPVGYLDMIMLEKNARLIITDSGGVQKEAFFHRVPCITLREETEWIELVEHGFNYLAKDLVISDEIIEMMLAKEIHATDLYGKGDTAHRIAGVLQG